MRSPLVLDVQLEANPDARLVIPIELTDVRRRQRRTWVIVVLVTLVASAAALWAGLGRGSPEVYRVEPVERRTIVRVVEALGRLDVPHRFEVPAPSAGRLVDVVVTIGQAVRQGTPLARLDRTLAALAVESAQGSRSVARHRVAEARAALSAASDVRARAERLASRGLASQGDAVAAAETEARARAALRALLAESEMASRAVAGARIQDDLMTIVAPADGVVLVRPEAVGGAVAPAAGPLFVIGDSIDTLHLEVPVAEADIAEVRIGQQARFTVPAFPGRSFTAAIASIGIESRRDRGSVTYPVTLTSSNPGRALLPGMSATVRIEVGRAVGVLAVREAALRFVPAGTSVEQLRTTVWRLARARRLEPVTVVAGLSDGGYTEVSPTPGERLEIGQPLVIGLMAVVEPGIAGPGVTLGKRR